MPQNGSAGCGLREVGSGMLIGFKGGTLSPDATGLVLYQSDISVLNSQVGFMGLWICLSVISKVNQQFLVCGRLSDRHSGLWFINPFFFFQINFVSGLGYCSRFILGKHSNRRWLREKSVWFTCPSHSLPQKKAKGRHLRREPGDSNHGGIACWLP